MDINFKDIETRVPERFHLLIKGKGYINFENRDGKGKHKIIKENTQPRIYKKPNADNIVKAVLKRFQNISIDDIVFSQVNPREGSTSESPKIKRITEIRNIDELDNLVLCVVNETQVLADKTNNFKVGDLVIYYPLNSVYNNERVVRKRFKGIDSLGIITKVENSDEVLNEHQQLKLQILYEENPDVRRRDISIKRYLGRTFIDVYGDEFEVVEYKSHSLMRVRYKDGLIFNINSNKLKKGFIREWDNRERLYEDMRNTNINDYYQID